MRTNESNLAPPRAQACEAPAPPAWVTQWIGTIDGPAEMSGHNWSLQLGEAHCFAQWSVRNAADLSDAAFEAAVADAYEQLAELLDRYGMGTPVRIWNIVPCIQAESAFGNRYMVFNAGRRSAFATRPEAPFDTRLIPASAVDLHGRDLVIQMLTAAAPARPFENPRQRPAYRYSHRYGPVAPSFARAAVLGEERSLIAAGTASIVGEDSRHDRDLAAQLVEIEINLAALIAAAQGATDVARIEHDPGHRRHLLQAYSHLRAYVVSIHDERETTRWVKRNFGRSTRLEIVPAALCRPGLRIEVEGLASLGPVRGFERSMERA
jgi:chorismate lyase/3-hydroxybenzoate synthase